MPNERLRAAMAAGGWTYTAFADKVEVDPKSVERWVNLGRTPRHPPSRWEGTLTAVQPDSHSAQSDLIGV